jgi:hypothetical protein
LKTRLVFEDIDIDLTMAEKVAAESALLEKLLAALDVRDFLLSDKKALEAALDDGMYMLELQSDGFVDDGFEAKCNFDKAHFILSGDSDNLLVHASRRGRIESVQYLLDLDADVDKPNGYGDSPLMAAAINGQVGVVRMLMDAGADAYVEHPEIKWGFTALVAAVDRCCSCRYGQPSCAIQQAQLAVVRCLLEEFEVDLKPTGLYGAASHPYAAYRPRASLTQHESRRPPPPPLSPSRPHPHAPPRLPRMPFLRPRPRHCRSLGDGLRPGVLDGHNRFTSPTSNAGADASPHRQWSSSKRLCQ